MHAVSRGNHFGNQKRALARGSSSSSSRTTIANTAHRSPLVCSRLDLFVVVVFFFAVVVSVTARPSGGWVTSSGLARAIQLRLERQFLSVSTHELSLLAPFQLDSVDEKSSFFVCFNINLAFPSQFLMTAVFACSTHISPLSFFASFFRGRAGATKHQGNLFVCPHFNLVSNALFFPARKSNSRVLQMILKKTF